MVIIQYLLQAYGRWVHATHGLQTKLINTYIVQKTNFYNGSMAPSDHRYIIDEYFKVNIDQWTHCTIIIGYNSSFKPTDNGSMIKWPMGGMGIS